MPEEDKGQEALRDAYSILARRARSEEELKIKLAGRGYTPSVIAETINSLRSDRYIDDEIYARQEARRLAVSKRQGDRLIEAGLKKKGLASSLIEAALREVRKEFAEKESLSQFLAREREKNPRWDRARKRRMINRLLAKGYPPELIYGAMFEIKEELLDGKEGE